MTAPLDIGLEQNDASLNMGQDDVFDLATTQRELRKKGGISKLPSDEMPSDEEDAEESEGSDDEIVGSVEEKGRRISLLEANLDSMYNAYREKMKERDAKYRVIEARKKRGQLDEWTGLKGENDIESGDDSHEEGGWEEVAAAKEVGDSSSDESDYDEPTSGQKRKRSSPALRKPDNVQPPSRAAQVWFSQDIFKHVEESDEDAEPEDIEMLSESSERHQGDQEDKVYDCSLSRITSDDDKSEESDIEVVPAESPDDADTWNLEDENVDQAKQAHIQSAASSFQSEPRLISSVEYGLTTAEAVTLAQQLVNRRTTKTHLLNDGFNRCSLNAKDGLPSWFLDDEAKHYKPNIPITKEAVAALRARQRALDARPIKKIAEAKGRKKLRAAQRLERTMKKVEGVNATADMSEREKAQQIEKLIRKGTAKSKKKEVKVIVAKGAHKGIKGRPKGVKGRYTMVDARMRKEVWTRCKNQNQFKSYFPP